MTDWIEWNGGDRPHPPSTFVDIRLSSGGEADAVQSAFVRWWHEGDELDIIAYRITEDASQ